MECSPLCTIEWVLGPPPNPPLVLVEERVLSGEEDLSLEEGQYSIQEEQLDPDTEKNQFTSVRSTLTWFEPKIEEKDFIVACRSYHSFYLYNFM